MAFSILLNSQYNGLLDDAHSFAVSLLGSDELLVYDQIYVFIHESYLSLLISYMHDYL